MIRDLEVIPADVGPRGGIYHWTVRDVATGECLDSNGRTFGIGNERWFSHESSAYCWIDGYNFATTEREREDNG